MQSLLTIKTCGLNDKISVQHVNFRNLTTNRNKAVTITLTCKHQLDQPIHTVVRIASASAVQCGRLMGRANIAFSSFVMVIVTFALSMVMLPMLSVVRRCKLWYAMVCRWYAMTMKWLRIRMTTCSRTQVCTLGKMSRYRATSIGTLVRQLDRSPGVFKYVVYFKSTR